MNKWKRKALALAALAEDQRGKPEGELAQQKLLEIINKHPEARTYQPLIDKIEQLTMRDLGEIKRNGGTLEGSWDGATFDQALAAMLADYQARLRAVRTKRIYEPA